MARGGGGWWYKGNADFDRRPGGSGESREYSKTYDVRSETEFTNRPEVASQLKEASILAQLEKERRARRENDAQSRVHVFPSVGKFIVPEHKDNWAVNIGMIRDRSQNLYFNPEKYPYFDKIIAEKLAGTPIVNPKHRDYEKYATLRDNLAVMRNDIIGIYMEDGSFDVGDEKYIPYIVGIAGALGDALAGDTWYKRLFAGTVNTEVANVEGVGAREMYQYLLSIQSKPAGKLEEFRRRITTTMGFPNRAWGLPPIEQTPYSPANLSAPLPGETDGAARSAESDNDRRLAFSENALRSAGQIGGVSRMPNPTKDASVEEARTILRWLRNLQLGDKDVEAWLDQGTPAEQLSKVETLSQLVSLYQNTLLGTIAQSPELARDGAAQDAGHAAAGIALALERHAYKHDPQGAAYLAERAAALPETAQLREEEPLGRLLASIELGFSHLAGTRIYDQSPAERLLDMSHRITAAAYRLRSVHDMQEPAREESIELAREILRRMKNLTFSDTPLDELAKHGSPEDKADLAQQVATMVEMYQNLLFEAVEANPGLMNDPRIKDANDAVGGFAHTIKLMAAKEIPNSVAAAQQISADVTRMPEEWKGLHHRTVGRLVTSMEGGLEVAVDEMMAEQQAQSQDEEVAEEVIEASLHSEAARRKRRKKRKAHGHHGGGKQLKAHLALTADDYILKQGRFREEGGSPPPGRAEPSPSTPMIDRPIVPTINGLSENDLAAIRNLGSSLRDIGNQANALPPMPVDEKIAPDDKTLAAREQEQRHNPKRPRDRM